MNERKSLESKIQSSSKSLLKVIGQASSKIAVSMRTLPDEPIYGFNAEVRIIDNMMEEIEHIIKTK
jgi:hypothetical protein